MTLTDVEKEVLWLWVVSGSLESMVNHALLRLTGVDGLKQVNFESATHQRLFNILLLDFLEEVDASLTGKKGSCLELLEETCRTGSFNENGSVELLDGPVKALRSWLDGEMTADAWLPSIEQQLSLKIKRRESLRICGNMSKHNLARLTGAAKQLRDILHRHDVSVDEVKAVALLNDFYERFHDDIFNYHSTVMAELLNNVCWGVHDYLGGEYRRAYVQDAAEPLKYCYRYPDVVSNEFVKSCYWELMNSVRRGPYMERFAANNVLKKRY